jgi:DNA-binding MarR family transcriptional regulator
MNNHDEPGIIPALERATHLIGVWVERAVSGTRLTQAEAHVLAFLAAHDPCSINDLHRQFGHRRSTLTSLLDRLEARGWVRRGAHPASRRLVLVTLTDAGREIAVRVSTAVRNLEDRVRARAGASDLAAFQAVLHALEEELAHEHR